MSDTPRTDKEAMANSLNGKMMADEVSADFSRKLELENNRLRDGYLHLLGQVEQAREGFGIYHNSLTMEEAVKTAHMILLPNVESIHPETKPNDHE
jgi:hypothetical protein